MNKFVKIHKKELHKSNCGFDHDPPEQMVRSQWQSRSKNIYYLIYRWIVAIFFTATVVTSISNNRTLHDWGIFFIYLTHWGILLNMITGIFGAVLVTLWHYKPDYSDKVNKKNEMPTAFKVYWGFHNTALITSCVITIIYWGILHNHTIPVNATNLLSHAFNSAIMLLDVLIVAYPIRIYHVIQPILFGNAYGLFTYIYYLFDGKNMKGQPFIYNVMDWRNTSNTFITIAAIHVLAFLIHMTLFYMYRIRVFIQRRIERKRLILPTTTNTTGNASLNDLRVSMVFGSNDGCNNAAFHAGLESEKGKV